MAYLALAVSAILVGIDQLTKWLAVTYVKPEGTIPLLQISGKDWLNLTYQENNGAAFSILRDKVLFLIILTSIVILGVIILMLSKRVKQPHYIWAFSLIVAGGVGNLIDRIANGFVVDFIDVRIINFAIFNFADIYAVTGTIALLIFYIIDEVKLARSEKAAKALSAASTVVTDSEKSEEKTDGK